MICEYCGVEGEQLEYRREKLVCVDQAACDKRDLANHEARLRELRKVPSYQLTEGERAELREAR